jgi:hypothetical protein
VVTRTLRAVFADTARDRVSPSNSLVIGSEAPISADRLLTSRRAAIPVPLRPLAGIVEPRLGAALSGGSVFTDDRAPVEWLTDLSILDYATGSR